MKQLIRILVCAAIPVVSASCGSSTSPTLPPESSCTFTVTINSLNGTPVPTQGTRFEFFFAGLLLPATAAVFVVDVNAAPAGCSTGWTADSSNTNWVQVSPARGTGRGQVELFLPPNTGAPHGTGVTIAGTQAVVVQTGR